MSRYSHQHFQNILLTLKKYQEGYFELLYISSEIRNILGSGDKFYEESFFNSILPTLPQDLFEFFFQKLGTGDKIICPIVLNNKTFQLVQIEGYVISQEDKSYLINALISPVEWRNNIRFSWLVNNQTGLIYEGISPEKELFDSRELLEYLSDKFDFIKTEMLDQYFQKEGSEVMTIFPKHLYLSKQSLNGNFYLVEVLNVSSEHSLVSDFLDKSEDLIYYEYYWEEDKLELWGALEKITGFNPSYFKVLTKKKWESLVHPEDLHIYRRHFGRVGKFTYRILHKNDYYIFVEEEISKIDDSGQIWLGVISDVTALKEIERDLLAQKSVLEQLTGVVPGMVYLMKAFPDHSHQYLFVSEGSRILTELDPKEILKDEQSLAALIHPEDKQSLDLADREAYLQDKKFEAYFRLITPSGKEKWVYGASNRLKQYQNESIWAGFFIDFSYTKQKELESSLNLQWYKTLFEENPLPIFQYDHKGTMLEVNRSFLEKIEIQDKQLIIGKNLFNLLGTNPIKKSYEESLVKGEGYYEGPYVSHFNNKLFHLRMTAKTLDGGKTFQAILEDISEQEFLNSIISQLTEKTSRLSGEDFFNGLTELLGNKLQMSYCFIAAIDLELGKGKVISYYKQGKQGEPFTYELKNSPCLDCISKNEPHIILTGAKFKYPKDKALQEKEISCYIGVPITNLDGTKLGILVLMDENDRPYNSNMSSLLKVLADRVGAEMGRINYEKKLIASEQLFRSIAENFPKGTVEVLDRNLKYVYAEGKEFQDKGINPKELIGSAHLSKYGSYISNKVRKHLDTVLQGESVMFEVTTDKQFYLKSGVPLVNNQGEIDRILLVTQNITETKLAEEEREQLIRDLKSQNEELQRFAYITSHNLRAPIVNISSLLELYDVKLPENPENKEVIENLKVSTSILNSTLEDLIEVVSIKKNKIPKVERIIFKQLTANVEKSLSKQIADSHAVIHKDFSKVPEINYIYSHLENFLINLTTNAIKYKHPERNPEIQIKTELQDHYVVLIFKDNGIGIDLERYGDRLFGLYQRFHSHVEGKGLGLYLVREQIRAHDGNLKVESTVGNGTTFKIFLRNLVSPSVKVKDILNGNPT